MIGLFINDLRITIDALFIVRSVNRKSPIVKS